MLNSLNRSHTSSVSSISSGKGPQASAKPTPQKDGVGEGFERSQALKEEAEDNPQVDEAAMAALLAQLGHFGSQHFDQSQGDKNTEVKQLEDSKKSQAHKQRESQSKPKPKPQEHLKPPQPKLKSNTSEKLKPKEAPKTPKSSKAETTSSVSHRPGTQKAPKTLAPRPVGQSQESRPPRPDQRVNFRLFPQNQSRSGDRLELSQELLNELVVSQALTWG